jgi:hypothetical protein
MCTASCQKTVFHDVPIQGNRRRILRKALLPMMRLTVIPEKDLRWSGCTALASLDCG